MVKPRDTLPGPLPAVINPTCFATTGEVVTLKAGLTVWPEGMNTDAGTLAPLMLLDNGTVRPAGGAGPVR
jgi:hypothetical protein